MKAVCLIDTSVYCEVLAVPKCCQDPLKYRSDLRQKFRDGEHIFLPLATIVETGNHIAHYGDGRQRRQTAERFIQEVREALVDQGTFKPTYLPEPEVLAEWLRAYPDKAMQGIGLGDLAIEAEWQMLCDRYPPEYRVYVWSKDRHLLSCDRPAI